MHLVGHMRNIRSMVSDTLKVTDRVQIQRYLTGLYRVHLTLCQLNQIFSQTAFIFVNQIFFSLYFVKLILLIFIQQIHGSVDILAKFLCHAVHRTVTLCNCQCRIVQQTFL